ncbi:MAG: two-component sensor histidine kinase, partial [Alphaproteobacteria bacterium]|nr:two-component sensor histidine kinase [Alphaproteobacteria bacterium]
GDVVEVSFADNGPGIPADALPLVLEPLFSTKAFGTGLGLPTVQRIVEEHGGSLRVDSTPGQGTQVTLRLPTRAKAKSA